MIYSCIAFPCRDNSWALMRLLCEKVSMCADNGGTPCQTIDAKINGTHQPVGYQDPNGVPYPITTSWKALLPPMPAGGSFTITATCTGCTDVNKTITLTNVTFGDMWYCSGQSNMWLPVQYSFSRNESLAAVQAGKYNNIRGIFAPSATTYQLGNQWMTALQAASDGTTDNPTYSLFQMGATCKLELFCFLAHKCHTSDTHMCSCDCDDSLISFWWDYGFNIRLVLCTKARRVGCDHSDWHRRHSNWWTANWRIHGQCYNWDVLESFGRKYEKPFR